MPTNEFLGISRATEENKSTQISSSECLMHFGKREEEYICCLSKPTSPGKFLSDRHKMRSRLREQERPDESGHLTETSEGVGALQTPASQSPA